MILDNATVEQTVNTQRMWYHQDTPGITKTTTTVGGFLNLTVTSDSFQVLEGTASSFSVLLPDARTLVNGWRYEIYNTTPSTVQISDNTGASLFLVAQTSFAIFMLQDNSTQAGTWIYWQIFSGTAGGIVHYKVTSSVVFTTNSLTYTTLTGASVTPTAGTYAIWYNGLSFMSSGNKTHYLSIHKAGVMLTDSERSQTSSSSSAGMIDSTITTTQTNGTDAIDVRIKTDGTQCTINGRTLLLIRLSN